MTTSTLVDLVKINVTSNGAGAISLGTAVPGYRGIEALTNGATYSYAIQQAGNWEYGRATYLSSGHQLVRSPIGSSLGGAAIVLSGGASVAIVQLAEDINDAIAASLAAGGAGQIAAIEASGAAEITAVNAAGTTQVGNVNAAGTTQVGAVTAAGSALSSAGVVTSFVSQMRSAVGSGSLAALFDMDGPRTAYSGSPTIMTAIQSLEGNAYSFGLNSTLYSGVDPRPVYTPGRGIYMSSGTGFQTTSQMLTKTSGNFAFLYAVDLNTLTSTVATESVLPGSPAEGDIVRVNADRNVIVALGADVPIVQNTDNFLATNLVNGYFVRDSFSAVWKREVYLFYAGSAGGQRFEARINHLGQLNFFIYDGSTSVSLISQGNVLIGQSVLTFAVRSFGGNIYFLINGKVVYSNRPSTMPNVNAMSAWFLNGTSRSGTAAANVGGLRHYFKGMAIADDLPDDAAFVRLHDAFAARHGGKAFAPPRAARGVIVMGQSWTGGSTGVTDTWRHGPNSWDGQVASNNTSYALERDCITRDAFPNIFIARDLDNPADIGPYNISQDASGNVQVANSHCGGSGGENFVPGWAKQVQNHPTGRLSDWYLAHTGVGGASIALLSAQTVVPLPTQWKTIPLASNDYYNKTIRQIVHQRDHALSKGQTYTVDLILWQQGHTDAGNTGYAATLIALYDRIVTDVQAITGQAHRPVLLAPQINYSTDGIANSCSTVDQQFLDMEDSRGTRPMFCIGPMYPYTNFIHPPRTGHRWAGEVFGLATARVLFDGESYGCCRPYAYTYSVGGTTVDIDYRVRSGRSMIATATNANNVYAAVSNAGYEFTDASSGGVTISSVAAVSASRIRVTVSGPIGAGDRISYTGATHRTGNVADGAAVDGLYNDQDWTATFTANEPPFKLSSNFNDLRQWAAASTKVL